MPQRASIVATKPEASDVNVFDCDMHPAGLEEEASEEAEERNGANSASPQHTLKGHSEPGFAVAWSPHTPGHLLSGATDGLICMWDIGSGNQVIGSVRHEIATANENVL